MTKLTITRKDNSIYWQQDFNSREEAEKWVAEEQTRKYWDKTFVVNYQDFPDKAPPTQQEQEALKQKGAAQDAARARLQSSAAIISADKVLSEETKNVLLDLIQVSL